MIANGATPKPVSSAMAEALAASDAMDGVRNLRLPVSAAEVRSLRAGDLVSLTGHITATIGLPTHERMVRLVESGQPLPVDLRDGAFLHLSCFNRETVGGSGFEALYLNPTTSTRYDALMPPLIRGSGVRVIGGKGGVGAEVVAAMQETGCIYLSFLGGGATLLKRAIRSVVAVDWPEYIEQFRLITLAVEDLGPATVGIDAHGNSIYRNLREAANARMPDILDTLRAARAGE